MQKYINFLKNKLKTLKYNRRKIKFVGLGICFIFLIITSNINLQSKKVDNLEEKTSKEAVVSKLEVPNVSNNLPNENNYNGFAFKELSSLGFQLELVKNPNDIIEGFTGKIYTKEESSNNNTKDFNAIAMINGISLNLKKIESFSSLENDELFSKSSDLNGDAYYINQDGQTKFFTRGVQSVLIESGDIFYAFIVNINDYQYCKNLQISLLDGVTIDSTITDLVNILGTPKCIDVYEVTNEKPYILCYYTKEQDNKKTSELSFVFVYDENAKNGYYLSEVTISMIE